MGLESLKGDQCLNAKQIVCQAYIFHHKAHMRRALNALCCEAFIEALGDHLIFERVEHCFAYETQVVFK